MCSSDLVGGVVSKTLAAAQKAFAELKQRHIADHQVYFRRVSLHLPVNAALAALPTNGRLARVKAGEADESLAALYFQYGRYLLLGSSRPGTLPANLTGAGGVAVAPPPPPPPPPAASGKGGAPAVSAMRPHDKAPI